MRSGLLIRMNSAYRFAHDRVHEAAYTLIPEAGRAQAHLRIGRRLLGNLPPGRSRKASSTSSISSMSPGASARPRAERERVAELNLWAAQRAKAGTAYASAVRYIAVGMDLLGEDAWERRYDLAFALWLEGAECEYLNGDFETTRRLISEVLSRARSTIDKAAAYRILIIFHSATAEYHEAIARGLECLELFGILLPQQPTRVEVLSEYERILSNLAPCPCASHARS